jgi:hypothetical protein
MGSPTTETAQRRRTPWLRVAPLLAAALSVATLALAALWIRSYGAEGCGSKAVGQWVFEWRLGHDRISSPVEISLPKLTPVTAHMQWYPVLDSLREPSRSAVERFMHDGLFVRASRGAMVLDVRRWDRTPSETQRYLSRGWLVGWRSVGIERYDAYNLTDSRSVHHTTLRTPTWLPLLLSAGYPAVYALRRGDLARRRRRRGLCTTCGYCLTGNVSGICPECGTGVPPSGESSPKGAS